MTIDNRTLGQKIIDKTISDAFRRGYEQAREDAAKVADRYVKIWTRDLKSDVLGQVRSNAVREVLETIRALPIPEALTESGQ